MTRLYEVARKAVGVHIDKYGDTPSICRRAELEDLVMSVAREYHEGEMRREQQEQPTPSPGRDDSKEGVAI